MQTVRIGYVEIGAGRPCIIAPITASSIDGVMDTATAMADLPVELAEWRLDMFADAVVETPEGLMPDLPYVLQSLAGLRTVIPVSLIATFRTVEEGRVIPILSQFAGNTSEVVGGCRCDKEGLNKHGDAA